jgi:hypothetical protein
MDYFYLKIFGLILFIFAVSYWNTYCSSFIESFSSNSSNQSIVLLGDSILKNNSYVSNGKAVDNILQERSLKNDKNIELYSLAENNSKIVDVYSQINKIPLSINNKSTTIFLSSGGNDILSFYVDQNGDTSDTGFLNTMLAAYKKLVKAIQTRVDLCQIVLLDVYYPTSNQFAQYKPILEKWNSLIADYARENSFGLLQISQIVTSNDDFTLGIEPSEKGGQKIAQSILDYN